MKIIDTTQGSPEWYQCRAGIPTASEFSRIIQPQEGLVEVPVELAEEVIDSRAWEGVALTDWQVAELAAALEKATKRHKYVRFTGLKPSAQQEGYINELIAERLGWRKDDLFAGSPDIERGKQLEAEARRALAIEIGEDIREVGFCRADGYGCSPDGLVGTVPVELKVPSLHTMVGYLRASPAVPSQYMPQVHGEMVVTGADRCHFFSYADSAALPNLYVCEKSSWYTDALKAHVLAFCDKLDAEFRRIVTDEGLL